MSPGHVLGSVRIGLHDPGNPPKGAVLPMHREETEDQPWPPGLPGMKRTLGGKNPGKKGALLLSHSNRGGGAPSCRLRTLALQRLQNKAWAASQGPAHTIPALSPAPAQPSLHLVLSPRQLASRHPWNKASGSSAIPGQDQDFEPGSRRPPWTCHPVLRHISHTQVTVGLTRPGTREGQQISHMQEDFPQDLSITRDPPDPRT